MAWQVAPVASRVLIIDDDRSVSAAIQKTLTRQGYDVALAPNAADGEQLFGSSRFDLVIVDIFMPETDGLEIIRHLRKQSPTIPILAMSGFSFQNSMVSTPDFLWMALKLGATARLRKPFTVQQLMAAIDASLHPTIVHARSIENTS